MAAVRFLPITVSTTVVVVLVLASTVSAAVRHTQELSSGFVAIEGAEVDAPADVLELAASDLNGDGVIGMADVNEVVAGFGLPGAQDFGGDVNADGLVDILDLSVVSSNFGAIVDAGDDQLPQ